MRDAAQRARVRSTIRLAAQMVEAGDKNTQLVSSVRIVRLDSEGNPTGDVVTTGPLLFTSRPLTP